MRNACARLSRACKDQAVALSVEMRVGRSRRTFGGVQTRVRVSLDCGHGSRRVESPVG